MTSKPGISDVIRKVEETEEALTSRQLVNAATELPIENFTLRESNQLIEFLF
jgi:hypothetical protein